MRPPCDWHGRTRSDTQALHTQQPQASNLPGARRAGQSDQHDLPLPVSHSESLRQEIQEGLNVIENWNGTNNFILYGKGEHASNDLENQEITMPALHLLQISLVYINTLMIQRILASRTGRSE